MNSMVLLEHGLRDSRDAARNSVLPTQFNFSQLTENGPTKLNTQNTAASKVSQKLNVVGPSGPSKVIERSSAVKPEEHFKIAKVDSQVIIDGEISMSKKNFGISFKKFVVGFAAVVSTNMSILP